MQAGKMHLFAWLMTVSLVSCFLTTKAYSQVEKPTQNPRTDFKATDAADARSDFLSRMTEYVRNETSQNEQAHGDFRLVFIRDLEQSDTEPEVPFCMLLEEESTFYVYPPSEISPESEDQCYSSFMVKKTEKHPAMMKAAFESCVQTDGWKSRFHNAGDSFSLVRFYCYDDGYSIGSGFPFNPNWRPNPELPGVNQDIVLLHSFWQELLSDSMQSQAILVSDADEKKRVVTDCMKAVNISFINSRTSNEKARELHRNR